MKTQETYKPDVHTIAYDVRRDPVTGHFACSIRKTYMQGSRWTTLAYMSAQGKVVSKAERSKYKLTASMLETFTKLVQLTLAWDKRKRATKAKVKAAYSRQRRSAPDTTLI